MDVILDKTITVFRFISDKDIFETHYKKHLSKRLLFNRSVSDDAERGMLAKLKVEGGTQFTQRMEGMFHDMKISSETMEAYHRHLQQAVVRSRLRSSDLLLISVVYRNQILNFL